MPAQPTRMTSLAPRTRPDDLVPAMVTVAATARRFMNERRETRAIWQTPCMSETRQGRAEWMRFVCLTDMETGWHALNRACHPDWLSGQLGRGTGVGLRDLVRHL